MGHEALGSEVGAGLELIEEVADGIEVLGVGQLGDGDGEGDAIEVGLRSERGGTTDFQDALWVLLGFEEGESGSGFLLGGEWSGGVGRED